MLRKNLLGTRLIALLVVLCFMGTSLAPAGVLGQGYFPLEGDGEEKTLVALEVPGEVGVNTTIVVPVIIVNVSHLDAADYLLAFDPDVLRLVDIKPGRIGEVTIPVQWNEQGPGRVKLVQDIPGLGGASGSGTLVELTFETSSRPGAETDLKIEEGVLSNTGGFSVEATWRPSPVKLVDWSALLSITTRSLPSGPMEQTYRAGLQAQGGSPPYAWAWEPVEGQLPPGLSLDPETGVISGTPGEAGTYEIAVQVTDSLGNRAGRSFSLRFGVELQGTLDVPPIMRPSRPYSLELNIGNVGGEGMEAPLLAVESPSGAPLRLFSDMPFSTGPLFVLGLGPGGPGNPGDILLPGQGSSLNVETEGIVARDIDYRVYQVPEDGTPLDWDELLDNISPYLEEEPREVVLAILREQVGETVNDYIGMLRRNARYLLSLAQNAGDGGQLLRERAADPQNLFALEVSNALAPHFNPFLEEEIDAAGLDTFMPLLFYRVFPQVLDQRYRLGDLGRGWRHNFEIDFQEPEDGYIRISTPYQDYAFMRGRGGLYQPLQRVEFIDMPIFHEVIVPASREHSRLTKVPEGYKWELPDETVCLFDSQGNLLYLEDDRGNRHSLGYSEGRLTSITRTGGHSFQLEYNEQGRISGLVNHLGEKTLFSYDPTGEYLEEVLDYQGHRTRYSYVREEQSRARHSLAQVFYPWGTQKDFFYDEMGRLRAEQMDGEESRLTYSYPQSGVVQVEDNSGATSTLHFDYRGLLWQERDFDGNNTFYAYDQEGNLISIKGPGGQEMKLSYDNRGNLVFQSLGDRHVRAAYTSDNNMRWIEDSQGIRTSFVYDSREFLKEIVHADGSKELFDYNNQGDLTVYTNRRDQKTVYAYNQMGQLVYEEFPDTGRTTYTYNRAGLLSSVEDREGRITMEYNDRDFLSKITYPQGYYYKFRYDDKGWLVEREDQAGDILRYVYDENYDLVELRKGNDELVVAYTYDPSGKLLTETRGNGVYTRYSYGLGGYLTGVENFLPSGEVLSRYIYRYDSRGKRISMETEEGVTSYTYDDYGQLTGVAYPDGTRESFTYDLGGNRVSSGWEGRAQEYLSNQLNQYLTVGEDTLSYDRDGNLVSRTGPEQSTRYQYDSQGRLVKVEGPGGTWEYRYDALGNRSTVIHNGETRHLVTDPTGFGNLSAEYDAEGNLLHRYIHGLGLVSREGPGESRDYYTFDGSGNTREITGPDAGVLDRYHYSAFGGLQAGGGEVNNPFTFVGQWGVTREENGLYNMRARFYDPGLGRFINPDPRGITTGELNLYRYSGNDPITFYDPTGEDFITAGLVLAGKGLLWCGKKILVKKAVTVATTKALCTATKKYACYKYAAYKAGTIKLCAAGKAKYLALKASAMYRGSVMVQWATSGLITAQVLWMNFSHKWPKVSYVLQKGLTITKDFIETLFTPDNPDGRLPPVGWWLAKGYEYVKEWWGGSESSLIAEGSSAGILAWDPNEKEGPGEEVYPGQTVRYKILFENDPLGYPKVDNLAPRSLEIKAQVDQDGTVYYVVLPPGAPPPGIEQLKQGQDGQGQAAEFQGSRAIRAFQDRTMEVTGLTPGTAYKIYVAVENQAGLATEVQLLEVETPLEEETPGEEKQFAVQSLPGEEGEERVEYLVIKVFQVDYPDYFTPLQEEDRPPVFPTGSTAPVQELNITDDLPRGLDWGSFQPLEFSFDQEVYTIQTEGSSYRSRLRIPDYRPGVDQEWLLEVNIAFDLGTGQARWQFKTLDPDTEDFPADPLAGFLPVNTILEDGEKKGDGEGYVTFSIKVREDAVPGTKIENIAKIYFDYNPAIITEEIYSMVVEPPEPVVPVPGIALGTRRVDFGALEVEKEAERTLVIYNRGTAELEITGHTGPFGPFSLGDDFARVIQPDQTETLSFTFAPGTAGDYLSVLTLRSNDPEKGEVEVELIGRALSKPAPELHVSPAEINFGKVRAKETREQVLTVVNRGSSDLVMGEITQPGGAFQVVEGADQVSGKTLKPGQQASLGIGFSPGEEGTFTGSLTITSNDPERAGLEYKLRGEGTPPAASLRSDRSSLAYGSVLLGETRRQVLVISNQGGEDLVLEGLQVKGSGAGAYALEGGEWEETTLEPGSRVVLEILFSPTAPVNYPASLALDSNDPEKPQVAIPLSGRGLEAALLTGLEVSHGELEPEFSPQEFNYALQLPPYVEEITITPRAEAGTITVGAQEVASGQGSDPIPLVAGAVTSIRVRVATQELEGIYEILVNREAAPIYYQAVFQVEDQEGNPINDATITFFGEELGPGDYTVTGLSPGVYNYRVNREGYREYPGQVVITDGDKAVLVILELLSQEECFIATAAYGSKVAPAVLLLRQFRDQYLVSSPTGGKLVDYYYRYSPAAAGLVSRYPLGKGLARAALMPVVATAYLLLHRDLLVAVLLWLLVMMMLLMAANTKKKLPVGSMKE